VLSAFIVAYRKPAELAAVVSAFGAPLPPDEMVIVDNDVLDRDPA
jgi:hypothetical protein